MSASSETNTSHRPGTRAVGLAALTLVVVSAVGAAFLNLLVVRRTQGAHIEAREISTKAARGVEKSVDQLFSTATALAAILQQSDDDALDLGSVVAAVHRGPGAVLLALDGRAVQCFPPDAPEASREIPWPADGPGDARLAGPLRQEGGGLAFFAIQPIFREEAGKSFFWGHVAVSTSVTDLAEAAGVESLRRSGFEMHLAFSERGNGRQRVFLRSTELELLDPEVVEVQVPGGEVGLYLEPRHGWPSWANYRPQAFLVVLLAFFAAIVVHEIARQPEQLRRQSELRGQSLKKARRRLGEEKRQRIQAEAREAWRDLDRLGKLVVAAIGQAPDEDSASALGVVRVVRDALRQSQIEFRTAEIDAAVIRLEQGDLLSRDSVGTLRVEQPALLSLPEAMRPLVETARDSKERIGPYRVIRRIGGGGMGEVFEAERTDDGSTAAIKLLYPHSIDDDEYRRRFVREGKVVASLEHPNIVRLLDRGEHRGRPFLAMELVQGRTLEQLRQERGSFSPTEAFSILSDVARALAALHEVGVVHRDVKSSNVIRTPAGRSVLLDFGLASNMASRALTKSDTILGTVPYMAPERLVGERGTPRADVWSAGILLFEMLTGRLPWKNLSDLRLVNEILTQRKLDLRLVDERFRNQGLLDLFADLLAWDEAERLSDGSALLNRIESFDVESLPESPAESLEGRTAVTATVALPTTVLEE